MVLTITDADSGEKVWSGPQRELFRKYASMRRDSQAAIVKAVAALAPK
jgi:hypothetical protein